MEDTLLLNAETFFDLKNCTHGRLFPSGQRVWKALDRLRAYLEALLQGPLPLERVVGLVTEPLALLEGQVIRGIEPRPTGPKGRLRAFLKGEELKEAAVILPGASLMDARILLGPGSVVEPGALIRGPAVIGGGCEIRQGAYMRGNCLVGEGCVVGHTTEMKDSVMLDGAKAGHFAYIGDSILGKGVNLGAGTKLANLRMIPGNIVLRAGRERHDTGRRKLGAILGDHTETGCNSVLSPGTLMGPRSIVYPALAVPAGIYPLRATVAPGAGSLRIRQMAR